MASLRYTKAEMIRSSLVIVVSLVVIFFTLYIGNIATKKRIVDEIEISSKYFSNKIVSELKKSTDVKKKVIFSAYKKILTVKNIDELKLSQNILNNKEKKLKDAKSSLIEARSKIESLPKDIKRLSEKTKDFDIEKLKAEFIKLNKEIADIQLQIKVANKNQDKKELKRLNINKKNLVKVLLINEEKVELLNDLTLRENELKDAKDTEEVNVKLISKLPNEIIKARKLNDIKQEKRNKLLEEFKISGKLEDKISSLSIENIAIWKQDKETGEIINAYHTLSKVISRGRNEKTLYGLKRNTEVNKDNVKTYFTLKINNQWVEENYNSLDDFLFQKDNKFIKNKKIETLHSLKKFELKGKEYVLDIQYSKRSVQENRMEKTVNKRIIVVLFFYLMFLFVYSLLFDKKLLMHILVLYVLIFTIYPLTWVISLTFNSENSLGGTSINPVPKNRTMDNYKEALLNLTKVKENGIVLEDNKLFLGTFVKPANLKKPVGLIGSIVGKALYSEDVFEVVKEEVPMNNNKVKKRRFAIVKAEKVDSVYKSKVKWFMLKMIVGADINEYIPKISKKSIKSVANVFDFEGINLKKDIELHVVDDITEKLYNNNIVKLINQKYYLEFKDGTKFDENLQKIYKVEYYTYRNVLFVSGILNSIFISVATALIGMMLSSAAAYAFSRFKFPGRDGFMMSFLVTQMFPNIMMLIPLYIIFGNLGLINTFRGLILAYSITALPFNIWNLKGFFDTIPADLEEAALIDGCSASQTFYKIVLPLSLPSLAISGLFSFMGAWNEYIIAATFMNSEAKYTIPVVIKMLVGSNSVNWPMFATMSVLVSIPVVLVFLMTQKYLVGGLTAGGVKG